MKYKTISPQILYFGTPVALITTLDAEGHANIGPISSVWALGHTLMLGLETGSKTFQNLVAQKQCVVNMADASLFEKVERIATLTGAQPIPDYKKENYKYDPDKFKTGGFTAIDSDHVKPPRIAECRIQFEAELKNYIVIEDDPVEKGPVAALEVRALKIHVDEALIAKENHIDPTQWNPLIYNFRHYSGLGRELGKTF